MYIRFDDIEIYTLLLTVGKEFGAHPSSSIEAEAFFTQLLAAYHGSPDISQLQAWLREQVAHAFIALSHPPKWLQESEWPFVNGQPMVFVGQLDVSVRDDPPLHTLFHDDTSLYIFISQNSEPVVIVQQI